MTLGELLRCAVVTEAGERLGRIYDAQLEERDGRFRITGLIVGRAGLRERLFGNIAREERDRPGVVAWSAVRRLEPGRVVVADESRAAATG